MIDITSDKPTAVIRYLRRCRLLGRSLMQVASAMRRPRAIEVRKTPRTEVNGSTLRMDLMARAFVINDRCIKDMRCVAACMRKAIHPTLNDLEYAEAEQLHINPLRCIGCGSCANVCPTGAILAPGDSPMQFRYFAELNAAWYRA